MNYNASMKQYLNDDNPPFMIEDCYSGESWNQPDFDDKCCGGGEELIMNTNYEDTLCIPTVQGGYCRGKSEDGDVKFFKYRDTVTGTGVNLKKEIKPAKRATMSAGNKLASIISIPNIVPS